MRNHYIIALGFVLILIFRNELEKLKDNSRRKRTMAIKAVIVQAVPIDVKTDKRLEKNRLNLLKLKMIQCIII